jgi:hypothetical protein
VKRRSVLLLLPLVSVAGCSSPGSAEPLPSISAVPDFGWPARSADLTSGFCFTLVRGIKPYALIERLGGDELERVEWHRVIGPGDGEVGTRSRFFIAIGRVEDWSVIVEDNGTFGITREIVEPLSADGGEVVAYRGGGGRPGRLMVFRDGDLALDLDTSALDRPTGSRTHRCGALLPGRTYRCRADRRACREDDVSAGHRSAGVGTHLPVLQLCRLSTEE